MCVLCVQFAEKFAEYKEAARLAKEKSQEKMEMATSPSQVGPIYATTSTLRLSVYNEQLANRSTEVQSLSFCGLD